MGVWRWCLTTPATPRGVTTAPFIPPVMTPGGARNGAPPTPLSPASPAFSPSPTSPCNKSAVRQSTSLGTGCTLPPSPRGCEIMTSDLRGEIGVGGVSTPSGPVLPGTMGEPILHPGSGEALRVLPPEGLGGAGPAKPGGLDDLLARRSQEAGRRQDLVVNPGRVARLRSHFTPTTGSGSGASPCRRPAALLFDIAGRAGGRVRSPSITVAAPRGRSRPAHRRPAP